MTIDERNALTRYRIEQAKETITEAELLLAHKKFRAAINRIYYAMFYMVLALGLKEGFETSKHAQLIGWFNKTFVKDERIARKYGKMLTETFDLRNQSDYDAYIQLEENDVRQRYEETKAFITALEHLILPDEGQIIL